MRIISRINSLFLGAILGMIFLAIMHTDPSEQHETLRGNGVAIGYRTIERSVLLLESAYQQSCALRK
jgi:hypothetical protein